MAYILEHEIGMFHSHDDSSDEEQFSNKKDIKISKKDRVGRAFSYTAPS